MSAFVTYQPTPTRVLVSEPPGDRMQVHQLLYGRIWLRISWTGLSGDRPRITRAVVERAGSSLPWRLYRLALDPARIEVVSKAEFDAWYTAHWAVYARREDQCP